ncbi:hypothetical protein, partial [Streptomyces sp. NPDC056982]|uniref:hypothetical protein n=1 Tax=Streptomyces sp. NPDC056982 TaxID=3345986 RepID=UPI003640BC77
PPTGLEGAATMTNLGDDLRLMVGREHLTAVIGKLSGFELADPAPVPMINSPGVRRRTPRPKTSCWGYCAN